MNKHKRFGIALCVLALSATAVALLLFDTPSAPRKGTLPWLSADQEAIVMTSSLLFVLGTISFFSKK